MVWKMNVGGVFFVTCFSFDMSSTSFASGLVAEEVLLRPAVRHAVLHRDDRIGEDGEVGPASSCLSIASPAGDCRVEVRGRGTGEVPAGREAPDADSLRVDAVVLGHGSGPHWIARCASASGRGMKRTGAIFRHDAVLEHERGDADAVLRNSATCFPS